MILIVGGTGNVGRHVVSALVEKGERVRVLTRDPERARGIVGEGAQIVEGDLTDPSSLSAALRGVKKAYLATNGGDQVLMESNFAEAAAGAGVRRVVKVSLVGAARDASTTLARVHAAIEERLAASGIPATILRANHFMENFLGSADTIAGQGAIYGAGGMGRVASVDARDIAAVAVRVLTEEGHEGKRYTVTGPEALTFSEAAQRIETGIGKEVSYVDMSEEDFKGALLGAGLTEMLAEIYAQGHRAVREGAYAEATGAVEKLTGRPPRTLEAFARDHAAALAGAATISS